MKNSTKLALALATLGGAAYLLYRLRAEPIIPRVNLLDNPSFEEGAAEPDFWWFWQAYSSAQWSWEATGRGRGRSLSILDTDPTNNSGWGQALVLMLQPNEIYELSGYIKTENVDSPASGGGAGFVVDSWDNALAYLGGIDSARRVGTSDWAFVSYKFKCLPATYSVNVLCSVKSATGKAWFDQLTLTLDTPQPI